MTIYDTKQLQTLLGIGENTARDIMRIYGFRTGYKPRSPLRITEDGVKEWVSQQMNAETPEDFFLVGKEIR